MDLGGRFETQVYRIETTTDQFLIIDYHAKPTAKNWVMVKRLSAIEIIIEPFRGQRYLGVVQMLEFYRLKQSEQGDSRTIQTCPG